MADRSDDGSDAARLEALLAMWFENVESGRTVDPRELCGDDLDLLEDFTRIIENDLDFAASIDAKQLERVRGNAERRRINDFELLTKIGTGGRGDVFLARQLSLGRFVAIKLLRPETANSEHAQRRLLREAELAASLEHPNIVPIYGVGQADGQSFIAMKWLGGLTLDALDGRLDPKRVAEIGATIARALHAAHLAGVTHRDIKPANIMFDEERPYILDFGLARGETDMTMTFEGKVSGTLPYMSPEQLCAGGKSAPLDGRTDVYSLGATLFELLEGRPPFESGEPGKLIQQILLRTAPTAKNCDRDLRTILARALEKDPDRRFRTAADLADDLDRYRRGEAVHARPVGVLERSVKLVRRNKAASAGIAVALFATLVFGTIQLVRMQRESENRRTAIQEIRTELDRSNPRLAARLLTKFAARYPEDEELARLGRQLRGDALLGQLLDRLQQPVDAQDPRVNLALLDEIEVLDAFAGRESQLRNWHFARATALALGGRTEKSREAAKHLESKRAQFVLAAYLDRKPWPWQLPRRTAEDLENAIAPLIVTILLRAAEVPPARELEEITAALAVHETDYRLRWQQLIWLTFHEQDPARVLTGLTGLLREGRYSLAVRGAMLRAALELQHRETIEHYYRRLRDEYPRTTWNDTQAAIVAASHEALGHEAELAELIVWAREKWPGSCRLAIAEARLRSASQDSVRTFAAIREAKRLARTPRSRDETELLSLSHEIDLPVAMSPSSTDLESRADALARDSRWARIRAHASLITARAILMKDPDAPADAILDRVRVAVRESPTPAIAVEAAHLALGVAAIDEGERYLERFDAHLENGDLVQPAHVLQSLVVKAFVAAARSDHAAMDRAIDAALSFEDAELNSTYRAQLGSLRSSRR